MLKKWFGHQFESSCYTTKEFGDFCKDYKKELKKKLPENIEIVGFNKMHFSISGFLKSTITNKLVYFSVADVRYSPNAWSNKILIRRAAHLKDYSGGHNNYSDLEKLSVNVKRLVD